MDSAQKFRSDLRRPPPAFIDISHPDPKSIKALDRLEFIANQPTYGDHVVLRYVVEDWDSIFRWISSLTRAVMDQQATTPTGREFVNQVLSSLPMVLLHRLVPQRGNLRHHVPLVIERVLVSTPQIVAICLGLWLLANDIEFPSTEKLCQCTTIYLTSYYEHNRDAPHGMIVQRYVDELLQRWDVPKIFTEYLIRETSRPVLEHLAVIEDNFTIARILILIYYVLPDKPLSSFLARFENRNTSRWATLVFLKLANPKSCLNEPDFALTCATECSYFLNVLCAPSLQSLLVALDTGIVLSIFQHRDLIRDDSHSDEPHEFAKYCSNILQSTMVTYRLYCRGVLVRVISSLKKVKKRGFDVERHLEGCGRLQDAWLTLIDQVDKRHALYKQLEDKDLGWYDAAVCEYRNCPHYSSLTSSHKYKRCLGCKTEIYCSSECQKGAWKSHHRRECQERKNDQGPSSIDFAYLRKCVYNDCFVRSRELDQLLASYDFRGHSPKDFGFLFEYGEDGLEVKVTPISELEQLAGLAHEDWDLLAVACLPWIDGKVVKVAIRPLPDDTGQSQVSTSILMHINQSKFRP
ncbi:hypothetical protein L218DRAFT_1079387 [Marasmius fiardii PR-910]|nr:hypothetical protein L218DRAFT_1079387 [Marasmius fiardii PR-910]